MSAARSPLFEPVRWTGRGFEILDESKVPDAIDYIHVDDLTQAVDSVREMKTRAFGQVLAFLYSGALVAREDSHCDTQELRRRLIEMTEQFCSVRPTFDFRGLATFFHEWLDKLPADRQPGEFFVERARALAQQIVSGRLTRARLAASILPDHALVLTHCNISGELVAIAHYQRAAGKEISVIATETRPYLQGTRLTAWELAAAGVPVAIAPDGAVAQIMERGEVNVVIVGADRTARNGDIINKVGTYPLALMAREYGVPFHALVQAPRSLTSGDDVPIEERRAEEVLTFRGRPLAAGASAELKARYPAFDVTPAALITRLIGFDRVDTPETFRREHHPVEHQPVCHSEARGRYVLVHGIPAEDGYELLADAVEAEAAESVAVPEMRPQLWGAQAVAPELLKRRLGATLISDNMMGTLFARGEIRRLCLFYDGVADNGVSAACGSLLAAHLARLHNVPVQWMKGAKPHGVSHDRDVSTFLGTRVCPEGVAVYPAAEEMIPWSLLKS
jgi:methylthioribose-1-phosphate isomerase